MSAEIILHSKDDEKILLELEKYCSKSNLNIDIQNLEVDFKNTNLTTIKVSGENIKEEDLPGFGYYSQLIIDIDPEEDDIDMDQSALLALLSIFYNTEVTVIKKEDKFTYLFIDGETPFYLETAKMDNYKEAFKELLGFTLVSTNPLLNYVLQVYLNTNIRRYRDFDLWFCEPILYSSIVKTLDNLNVLVKEGYFVPEIRNKTVYSRVVKNYSFQKLGYDLDNDDPLFDYSIFSNVDIVTNTSSILPIRGPILKGYRLDKEFFYSCYDSIEQNEVPYITVKVDYICDRKTQAGCVFSSIKLICGSLAEKNSKCINSLGELINCKNGRCNYLSCYMLDNINVLSNDGDNEQSYRNIKKYRDRDNSNLVVIDNNGNSVVYDNESNNYLKDEDGNFVSESGWINLVAGSFSSLEDIINQTEVNRRRMTIINVSNEAEGLLYRYRLNRDNYSSLLLNDTTGYFVAVWDYDGIEPEKLDIYDIYHKDNTPIDINSLYLTVNKDNKNNIEENNPEPEDDSNNGISRDLAARIGSSVRISSLNPGRNSYSSPSLVKDPFPLSSTSSVTRNNSSTIRNTLSFINNKLDKTKNPTILETERIPVLSISKLEELASSLSSYDDYGKGYASMGIYSIPGNLPGLLAEIPVPSTNLFNDIKLPNRRAKEIVYEIKTISGDLIETVVLGKGESTVEDIYGKYSKKYNNIIVESYERNFLSSFGKDSVEKCIGNECSYK